MEDHRGDEEREMHDSDFARDGRSGVSLQSNRDDVLWPDQLHRLSEASEDEARSRNVRA